MPACIYIPSSIVNIFFGALSVIFMDKLPVIGEFAAVKILRRITELGYIIRNIERRLIRPRRPNNYHDAAAIQQIQYFLRVDHNTPAAHIIPNLLTFELIFDRIIKNRQGNMAAHDQNMRIKQDEVLKAKVTIMYILDYFGVPLTREQFADFIAGEELLNFFDLQRFTEELLSVGHIKQTESEGRQYLLITESGSDTVKLFTDTISQPMRRKINDAIDERKKSFNCRTNIMAEYVKLDESEYNVQLTINEGAYRLMYLDLTVLTNKDAKQICENWRNNARFLYGDLLHLLMNGSAAQENSDESADA